MSIKAIHWTDPMDDGAPPAAELSADLPEWLAARRDRRPSNPSIKSGGDSSAIRIAIDQPSPATVPLAAATLPVPVPKAPLKTNSKRATPVIEVSDEPEEDDSSKSNWLNRWFTKNVTIGFATSLFIHTVALLTLAFIVISNVSQRDEISLFGVAGDSDDIGSEMLIDTTLPTDGGESAPLLLNEMAQASELSDAGGAIPEMTGIGLGGKGHGLGESGDGNSIGVPALRVPGHAQNKGSFSAWTEPRDPEPDEAYFIVIQVRLPRSVKKYRASDLSGSVSGTDRYFQKIPAEQNEVFPIENGSVEIRISVPGGQLHVQDTIQIASKLLKEKQTFKIEF